MGVATHAPFPPELGSLVIDAEARSARVEGSELYLTELEFRVLAALAEEPGRTFACAALLEAHFADMPGASIATIERSAQRLERKLELRGMGGQLHREPGVGLRIESPGRDVLGPEDAGLAGAGGVRGV